MCARWVIDPRFEQTVPEPHPLLHPGETWVITEVIDPLRELGDPQLAQIFLRRGSLVICCQVQFAYWLSWYRWGPASGSPPAQAGAWTWVPAASQIIVRHYPRPAAARPPPQ